MENNINSILNSVGINIGEEASTEEAQSTTVATWELQTTQEIPLPAAEIDLNEILRENGFEEEYTELESPEEFNNEESEIDGETVATSSTETEPFFRPEEVEENTFSINVNEGEDINEEEPEEETEETMEVQQSSSQENPIPTNSPSISHSDSTSRFSGTEWYSLAQTARVIVAGCGGIGSWTALQLSRLCPEAIILFDDDIVETANMSGQFFCIEDVGKKKVDAVATSLRKYTSGPLQIIALPEQFVPGSETCNIMICGFDNMEARRYAFTAWNSHVDSIPESDKANCLFIDGRLDIDTLQVFCIRGDDKINRERYLKEYLFSDSEAEETICSLKQTTYMACMIGSIIVNLFVNFVASIANPAGFYDLPFFTEYNSHFMLFNTLK